MATAPQARSATFLQLGVGAATAAVAVPASLWLGSLIGVAFPSLLASALPALLLLAVVPPLAVVAATVWASERFAGAHFHLQPALWITAAVHVATLVVAGFFGVSMGSLLSIALLTGVECLLLPAATTLTLQLGARAEGAPAPRAAPQAGSPRDFDRATFVPFATWELR